MNTLQIFKGGWSHSHDDRLAVVQRPADGHLKAGVWEDHIRVNKQRFKCAGTPKLEVGDVIAIHACPTLGLIDAMGIAVHRGEEGLKFKIVCSDSAVGLGMLTYQRFEYNAADKKYQSTDYGAIVSIDDIGSSQAYYVASPAPEAVRLTNSCAIGLEVVALPADGLAWTFDIESRLQFRQPARPPADMHCC